MINGTLKLSASVTPQNASLGNGGQIRVVVTVTQEQNWDVLPMPPLVRSATATRLPSWAARIAVT